MAGCAFQINDRYSLGGQTPEQIEKQIEGRVNARVQAAVNQAQAKQSADFAKVLDATERRFETQRQADLASFQQVDEYYHQKMARLEVASNEGYGK